MKCKFGKLTTNRCPREATYRTRPPNWEDVEDRSYYCDIHADKFFDVKLTKKEKDELTND